MPATFQSGTQPRLAGIGVDLKVILQRERRIGVNRRDDRTIVIPSALHLNHLPNLRLIDVPITQAQAGNHGHVADFRHMGNDGQRLATLE